MRIKVIISILSIFVFGVCWLLWNNKEQTENVVSAAEKVINPYLNAEIKTVIISAENNTYGYDIYVSGSVMVHQPSRPGLSGNTGFATEEDAMKVSELVVRKIRNNELPPTVTIEELQELGVL